MGTFARTIGALMSASSLAAGCVLAAGSAGGEALPGISSAPLSQSAAQAQAAALLTELSLPAGAAASSSEPPGDGGFLAHPAEGPPATPNAVDDHAWWIVPGAPAGVRAYIDAHLAAGSAPPAWGAQGADGVTDLESTALSQPELTGHPGAGQLVLGLVALPDGTTGLRADAQVVWVTSRPASEAIPPGAHILWVSVTSSIQRDEPTQRPLRIVSTKRIDAIVALLNGLPASQPGLRFCPFDPGVRVHLDFYTRRRAPPLADAVVDPAGCGLVSLVIEGAPQPPLERAGPLMSEIDKALGVELRLSPRRRSVHAPTGTP